MEVSIKEAVKLKRIMDEKITAAIFEFELTTGMVITDILMPRDAQVLSRAYYCKDTIKISI